MISITHLKKSGVIKIKQALFLKTKNIGDSIILTSAISALPKDYQYIDIVCLPESEPIFKMHPRVRHVFVIPRHLKSFSKVMAYIKFYQEITSYSYDLLAHFSNDWRGALLQRIFPAKLSVARKTHRRGQFWHQSFDILTESLDDVRPIAEQDVDLLRAVGLYGNVKAPPYLVKASINQKSKIKNWLSKHSIVSYKKLVVIHAPSRWKFKELPIATWANVIDKLKEKKFEVVLCGSKEDLSTNQAIFTYEKNSQSEVFHLHNKYIEHFDLNFEDNQYNSLDGPVVIYMGKTPDYILRYYEIWNMLSDFGYKKEFNFGYEGIVCGNWSLAIPMSEFKLKWIGVPFTPHHNYDDRY